MKLSLRCLAIGASSICIIALAARALQQPPVPSKVLPAAQAPTATVGRTLTSPITGRVYAIRVEPKEFDSDAEEAAESARNKAPGTAAPPLVAKKEGVKKSALEESAVPKIAPAAPAPANIPASEFYQGSERKAAKLSIADGLTQSFNDVRDLIATLPPKTAMVNHSPRITTDPDSGRVTEENRNLRVRCWLYASSRESDNDHHLILGRAPGLAPETYMTMEVSGLPPTDADSFPQLFSARKSFNDFFGTNQPGTDFDFYNPPIPVIIEGSLFFDITHANGPPPGPTSLRPNMPVIWEVHPVTKIEFEPTS